MSTNRLNTIELTKPLPTGGATLIQAMLQRRTNRDFDPSPLSEEHLSGIFWSAYGNNREDGHRTVPSAVGIYPLKLYAVTPDGVYLYEEETNSLRPIENGDYRAMTGMQDFVTRAPLNIVIFYDEDAFDLPDKDMAKMIKKNLERVVSLDAGAVTQNIYLYCAANKINCVERMSMAGDQFKKALHLPRHQEFVVAMTIGYAPKN